MTSFDELIGGEPTGNDRERLRSVHDLLTLAGPPPELDPKLAKGPTLAMTLSWGRKARESRRSPARRMLVPAVAAAALLALVIGISTGGHGQRYTSIAMRGTVFAPQASGTLELLPAKDGKQPMRIIEQGLPKVRGARYVVYLVRKGNLAPCGSFVVTDPNRGQFTIESPYRVQEADSWVVKEERAGSRGATVLQPANA